MRKYFMIALILLTCLRGWVGDAMAMEMSRMHSETVVVAKTSLPASTVQTGLMPCHGEGQESAEQEQPSTECTACQVCHSPALQTAPLMFGNASPVVSDIGHAPINWVSADLTHLQKPPVS